MFEQLLREIEAKLDPGGSFYAFIDGWFTMLQASVADAQNAIASTISDSQAAIQASISNAQAAMLINLAIIEAKLDPGGSFYTFVDNFVHSLTLG